jgi:carbon-monoxide dehydrogenase medium subunit
VIATEFAFHAPTSVADALALLDRHRDRAKVLAGGMSLVPLLSLGLVHPEAVVSLNHVGNLDAIREVGNALRLGALARHDAIHRHPQVRRHLPLLSEAAAAIGDVQVRNRGSLGGSLVHADPAADYLGVMLVLHARFRLQRLGGERWLDAREFFADVMTTTLQPDELLTEIEIPKLPPGSGCAHERLRRVEGAFPIVTASVWIAPGLGEARLGLGGVGPRPCVLDITSELSQGVTASALTAIGEAADHAASGALADLNGSVEYRRAMARTLSRRAVRAAVEQL